MSHDRPAQDVQYAVTDPTTGKLVRRFPRDTDERVMAAVARAHDAFGVWGRQCGVSVRAETIARVAELHVQRRKTLADLMVQEMGKSLEDALGEIDFSADIYRYYAENAETFLADEPIELMSGTGTAVIRRQPLGVLLGIMPWNYPAYQVARFAGPNLVAGNTIVLKHAPQCPESATALQEIFVDAGVPEGGYENIYASHDQIEQVIADRRVQGVSLTGSERAGAAVAQVAGRHLKKVVLELGGSDPFIVLSCDDLDATVDAAVAARMENTGQACNAAKRMIIHRDLYGAFVAKFTTRMLAAPPRPLSSVAAAENLEQQVAVAVGGGAKLTSAGSREGAFFPAAVLTGLERDNPAYQEELFGPVAMVFQARDEADAIEIANDTPFGLGSYIFTNDAEQAARVADQLEAGMVFVNGVGLESAELPFGGVKRSGFGRELGRYGIDEFVNRKLIRSTN
jgi:succinate-semialdehyde dehydrogenase/glutarate-semialdehyde dehydrogenase